MQYLIWRKSRRSEAGEACVEVAASQVGTIGVRDSKSPTAGCLSVSRAALADLVGQIKAGKLDL